MPVYFGRFEFYKGRLFAVMFQLSPRYIRAFARVLEFFHTEICLPVYYFGLAIIPVYPCTLREVDSRCYTPKSVCQATKKEKISPSCLHFCTIHNSFSQLNLFDSPRQRRFRWRGGAEAKANAGGVNAE